MSGADIQHSCINDLDTYGEKDNLQHNVFTVIDSVDTYLFDGRIGDALQNYTFRIEQNPTRSIGHQCGDPRVFVHTRLHKKSILLHFIHTNFCSITNTKHREEVECFVRIVLHELTHLIEFLIRTQGPSTHDLPPYEPIDDDNDVLRLWEGIIFGL